MFASSDINFTTFLLVNNKSSITTLFYIVYNKNEKYDKTDKNSTLAIEVIIQFQRKKTVTSVVTVDVFLSY